MHHGDVARDIRQVERFFDGRVAAANHYHVLFAVEEAVAGSAGGNAAPAERFFARQAQILGGSARGDDERIAGVGAGIALQAERALAQVHGMDVVVHQFRAEPQSMLLHALHERRAHQAMRVTGPIVHFGGGHQLAAHFKAGHQQRRAVGAGGVDGGGVAGRAGTEDEEAAVAGIAHGGFLQWAGAAGEVPDRTVRYHASRD